MLTWSAPVSDGGGAVTSYRVERSVGSGWTGVNSSVVGTSLTVTGLTNGTAYTFRVSATNSAGTGTPVSFAAATPRSVAGAPTAVAVTPGDSSIAVRWSAPLSNGGSAITNYVVQTSTDAGVTWTTATTTASTSATLTSLTNGVTVLLRVLAVNAAGQGAPSSVVAATPAVAPDAPSSLAVIAGDTSVTLTWGVPAATGGSPVSSYVVEQSTDAGRTWQIVTTTSSLSASITGLANGNSYLFRVSAVNGVGTGPAATVSSAAVPSAPPSAPRTPTAVASDATVTLNWTAPSATGGGAVTGYVVEQSTDGGLNWSVAANTVTTSATISGLANGTAVQFRIRANNSASAGAWSSIVTATPAAVPGAPLSFAASALDAQIVLTWDAPASDGGSSVISYLVERSLDGTNWTTVTTATARTVVVTGLVNGQSYRFRVSARNAMGSGPTTQIGSNVAPRTVATAPLSLVATAGDGRVDLAWAAPSSDGGSPITGYVVERSSDGGSTWTRAGAPVTTSLSVTGLQNGTALVFRVRAVNAAGEGANSANATARPIAVPGAPTALATTVADSTVTINWSAPVSDGGSTVLGFRVEYSVDGIAWTTAATSVTSSSFVVGGLLNGTGYRFRVTAFNAAGLGVAATTPSPVTPVAVASAPESLTATAGNASVVLAWAAPFYDGGATVTGYVVEYSIDGGRNWVARPAVAGRTSTVTGLTNGVAYVFRVRSVNAAGTGAPGRWVTAAPVAPPTTPSSVESQSTPGTVTVMWSAPVDDGGSQIVGYRVQQSTDGVTWVATVQLGPDVFAAGPMTTAMETDTGISSIVRMGASPTAIDVGGRSVMVTALADDGLGTATALRVEGLEPGGDYWFRVQAYTVVGDSGWAEIQTLAASPPAPIAPPTVTPTGDGGQTLSWTPPASDGGSPVTYLIERTLDGGTTWASVATTSGQSFTIPAGDLPECTSVRYRITPSNAAGAAAPVEIDVPAPCSPPTPVEEPAPVAALPVTGSDVVVPLGALALGMLLAGAAAVVLSRRRRRLGAAAVAPVDTGEE